MNRQDDVHSVIDEITTDIYRISVIVPPEHIGVPGGFTFNQYLILDDKAFLYHTGPQKMFGLVCEAIEKVMPVSRLAYIGFSHVEADECGSLNQFLQLAPDAVAVCTQVAAMTSVNDFALRRPKAMSDGEILDLGQHKLRWLETPHVPHGWESGMAFDITSKTLFSGDLFTQPGCVHSAITGEDILESSEAMRAIMDYYAHGPNTTTQLLRLAELEPKLLACMHGSAWHGDGASLLRALAKRLSLGSRP